MGGILSNLCDCTHKDPRTEINMFLTQNQTIQFSSPIENIKIQKNGALTSRSGSTLDNSKQKIKKMAFIKLKNYKKNIIHNNKLIKKKNIFAEDKKILNQNKQNKININLKNSRNQSSNFISSNNTNTFKTFNSNISYWSNQSIPQELKELIATQGNSEIYIGEKKGKIKEGLGLQIWNKETFYFGNYKNNKINGLGKFISGNTKFKGEFKNDEANGYGIYSNNKLTYEGYWNKDRQSSFGFEKWKDGTIYKGQYYNGKKNGIGTYIFEDGNKYEGEFINNAFHGYGIYYFNDKKRVYLGQWANNEKNGYGEFIMEDKIFIGYYSKDRKNGFGISFWKKEKKYFMGFWKNGIKFGPWKKFIDNKITYGKFDKEGNVKKIENGKNKFYQILKEEGLIKYKNFFELSFEIISNHINSNGLNDILNNN